MQQALSTTSPCATTSLIDIAPFEWDRAVILRAYLGQADVIAQYGFDPGVLGSAVQDGVLTIYFLRSGGEVVTSSELPDLFFRFAGHGAVIDRTHPELTAYKDDNFYQYFVPGEEWPANPVGRHIQFEWVSWLVTCG